MQGFTLLTPARTIFGRDSRLQAADEIAGMGQRILLLRSGSVAWADVLAADLIARGLEVAVLQSAGEPTVEDVRRSVAKARGMQADCIVAVGGGATVDLGKAVSGLCVSEGDVLDYLGFGASPAPLLQDPLPFVAIPTTSGTGAEATRNAVISLPDRQLKISLRDPRLLPDLALVDPALTDDLPKGLTLATGLDALTQLVESYLCNRANPLTDALCRDTIPAAMTALRQLMEAPAPAAREAMARASYISGVALANSGLGVVHGLAAVIGSRGGAHGAICGRLLPAALTVNRAALIDNGQPADRIDQVDAWLWAVFGTDDAPSHAGQGAEALRGFIDHHGLASLEDLHCGADLWPEIAQSALTASSTKANPVALSDPQFTEILAQSASPRSASRNR